MMTFPKIKKGIIFNQENFKHFTANGKFAYVEIRDNEIINIISKKKLFNSNKKIISIFFEKYLHLIPKSIIEVFVNKKEITITDVICWEENLNQEDWSARMSKLKHLALRTLIDAENKLDISKTTKNFFSFDTNLSFKDKIFYLITVKQNYYFKIVAYGLLKKNIQAKIDENIYLSIADISQDTKRLLYIKHENVQKRNCKDIDTEIIKKPLDYFNNAKNSILKSESKKETTLSDYILNLVMLVAGKKKDNLEIFAFIKKNKLDLKHNKLELIENKSSNLIINDNIARSIKILKYFSNSISISCDKYFYSKNGIFSIKNFTILANINSSETSQVPIGRKDKTFSIIKDLSKLKKKSEHILSHNSEELEKIFINIEQELFRDARHLQ